MTRLQYCPTYQTPSTTNIPTRTVAFNLFNIWSFWSLWSLGLGSGLGYVKYLSTSLIPLSLFAPLVLLGL